MSFTDSHTVVFFPSQPYDLRMNCILILLASLLVVSGTKGVYKGSRKSSHFIYQEI